MLILFASDLNKTPRRMTVDFQRLQNEVSDCRALLLSLQSRLDAQPVTTTPENETPLNVEQAAGFLGISKQTVYQNIDKIPHSKRFGRLYFYPADLRAYLDNGNGGIPA